MPNSHPLDRFYYPTLTLVIDSYIVVRIDFQNMGQLPEVHELTDMFSFLYFSCSDSDDSDEESSNKSE